MKVLSVLMLSLLVYSPVLHADPSSVRPLGSVAHEAFVRGMQRSETFRALVAGLEQDGLIVHIVSRRDLPPALTGATRFVADRGGAVYLRIELSASLQPAARVSVLGHELQHALEIASSGARNSAAVVAFYRIRGKRAPGIENGWETTAAEAIERRIWRELHDRGPRPTRAVENSGRPFVSAR